LAQNKFYGLAQAKATPINTLRSKLEDALRTPNGMKIPEKVLNLEAEGSRKYRELSQLVLQETQAAKKGKGKAVKIDNQTTIPASSKPAVSGTKTPASSSKVESPKKPTLAERISERGAAAGRATSSSTAIPGRVPGVPQTKAGARKTTGGPLPPRISKADEILDNYGDLVRDLPAFPPHTKQTARKSTGGLEPRKRDRSPGDSNEGPSNKRARLDDDDDSSMFGYLTGTYDISAPHISEQWGFARYLSLVVSLDSEKRLFGTFDLGICSGVLRSTVDMESRTDGASAKFEWCGQEEHGGSEVYTPSPEMKGILRFTRRRRDGRHTIKGTMECVRAVGKCEFTGEKVGNSTTIYRKWDDFNEEAYEWANKARWR